MLSEAEFPFLAEKGHVVSLVGGGGKTTLLYNLSVHCARKGWQVLAATTTHIQQPDHNFARTEADLEALWAAGAYAVLGTPDGCGKLTAPPPELLRRWMQRADAVFLEADGAKRMPCKAPAAQEPVLLPECDTVLAVAGLSALGRPLQEVCFRLDEVCTLLDALPTDPLTPELLAALLADKAGGRKLVGERAFYAVLNQADDPARRMLGERMRAILREQYHVKSVLTSFAEGERA